MQWRLRGLLVLILMQSVAAFASEQSTVTRTENTGAFTLDATISDLVPEATAQAYLGVMPIDEPIAWEVYVPSTYDADKPAGVLVYISPSDSGTLPIAWEGLIDQYNLIWVAANQSGNKINTHRRMTYAIMALAALEKRYEINQDRIYLSGFSGGGRVASLLAIQYPTLFKGAIYNSGANPWDKKTPIALDQINNNRYVFITGRKDFNLSDTKRVFRSYKKAGIKQIKLMVIPSMGHRNPNKKNFQEAIDYLDQATLE